MFFDDVSHSLPARVQTGQIEATPATGRYTYRNVTLCRYFNIQPRMLFSPNHSNENSVAGASASDDVQRSVAIAIQCAQVDTRESQLVDDGHRLRLVELFSEEGHMMYEIALLVVALRHIATGLAQLNHFRANFMKRQVVDRPDNTRIFEVHVTKR